ncbi:MAG: hypothetical protein E3J69_04720 [Anaerolineales bacterium]|nr:MAG: hypothetical protein E3J69_04720 [Anaerolineales bacterium]
MKRILNVPIILLLLLMLSPSRGIAQSEARLESLKISLWPEYDRPGVLVLYEARVSPEADFPAIIRLPLPDGVDAPHAVAAHYPDGQLDDNVKWQVVQEGTQAFLDVETPTTGVWVEFYSALDVQDANRSFDFLVPGGIAIADLSVEVMHPVGASDVSIKPEGKIEEADNGLVFTTIDLGGRSASDKQEITLSYRKPSSTLLSAPLQLGSASPLERLEVALLPEYDQPSVLVILRGVLSPAVELPAHVEIPVPVEYGEPSAVAIQGPEGQLFMADYQRRVQGQWATIVMEAESAGIWIEFYADLTHEGDKRSFTFFWPGGMDIAEFQYEIQQPWSADNIQVTAQGVAGVHTDGLVYHSATYGLLSAASQALITFAYENQDSELTINTQPKIDRPDEVRGETPDFSQMLPYILGGVGLVLIAAGAIVYVRFKRQDSATSQPRKRKRRRKTTGESREEVDASPVYCHLCGVQGGASDHYCRRCGAQLRH